MWTPVNGPFSGSRRATTGRPSTVRPAASCSRSAATASSPDTPMTSGSSGRWKVPGRPVDEGRELEQEGGLHGALARRVARGLGRADACQQQLGPATSARHSDSRSGKRLVICGFLRAARPP